MKATAALLPTEEEIKEGVLVRDSKGRVFPMSSKCNEMTPKELSFFQPVKLFAVTQDIEAGDEVYCPNYRSGASYFTAKVKDKGLWVLENGGIEIDMVVAEMLYKPLGEISPNATWVKDGDEIEIAFDVKDISLEISIEEMVKVKVKCSQCNTYH